MSQREQLLETIAANLEERSGHQDAYDGARRRIDEITEAATARGDGRLTPDETQAITAANETAGAARADMARLDEERQQTQQRVDDIDAAEEARTAAQDAARRYGTGDGTRVRVDREEAVYRRGGEHSFFADAFRMRYDADPGAAARLGRHQAMQSEEARAVGSAAFAGLVVPQYLVDDYASVARAGRPFADFVVPRDLPPEGMTLNVPRGTTGTIVGSQTQENANLPEQDLADVDIVVPVRTIAGQQNLSRQAIDRGRNTDGETMQDLSEAYAAEVDRQIIAGTGTAGQHLGILSTTGVSTITVVSTAGVVQVRQLAGAVSRVHTGRFMPATVIVVSPRRWAYWAQSTDSQGRPLVTPRANGPQNVFGTGDLANDRGIVGDLYGVPVLADANMPTTLSFDVTQSSTTDPIIVTRASDMRLYENAPVPRRVRFEETSSGSLTVKVVAFDYSAWTAGRYPAGTVVLAGSGLTTPVFGT